MGEVGALVVEAVAGERYRLRVRSPSAEYTKGVSVMQRTMVMERRRFSWVPWVIAAVVVFLLWNAIGGFMVLPLQQQGLAGKVGEVWNQVDRANQLLPRLEAQLKYSVAEQKQVIDKITIARNDILAAEQASGDQAKILKATASTQSALKAFYENYPDFGLPAVQQGLLDETAGSFNRIAYARGKLIEAQVSYNQTRIFFPLAAAFSPPVEVLGSGVSPLTPVTPSTLTTPTP